LLFPVVRVSCNRGHIVVTSVATFLFNDKIDLLYGIYLWEFCNTFFVSHTRQNVQVIVPATWKEPIYADKALRRVRDVDSCCISSLQGVLLSHWYSLILIISSHLNYKIELAVYSKCPCAMFPLRFNRRAAGNLSHLS